MLELTEDCRVPNSYSAALEKRMQPLIAGNWKMHGAGPQLREIAAVAASVKATRPSAQVLICLPATLIARAMQAVAGCFAIGGEDCSAEISSAFTGDFSAGILKDADARGARP
jgi:triosephosphate isomerase